MSDTIKIKQGLDIKLRGAANTVVTPYESDLYAMLPADFIGVTPRLKVQEGDAVKAGSVLFASKADERIVFTSPVSGIVESIVRGEKRLLEAVVVRPDGHDESISYDTSALDSDSIKDTLLKSGLWPSIRQRPYSTIANPDDTPTRFYVSAFDTSPLAPDMDYVASQHPDSFQKGLDIISLMIGQKIHLSVHSKHNKSDVFLKAKNVILHHFSGPHPSGNISTQINKTCPINKGDIVWYCHPQDIIAIGKLFNTGRYDSTRIVALTGSQVKQPHYYRTHIGASLSGIASNNQREGVNRYISGNVLTGRKVDANGYLGYYHSQFTIIPEGDYYEMLGWIWPGFKKFSFSRTFPIAFLPSSLRPSMSLDTNTHGEVRPFVVTGEFEKVFPLDIYPMQLIKACIVKDIDLMENLGIYEVDEEDFALCEFIDPSKTEIQKIIREGINLVRKELG